MTTIIWNPNGAAGAVDEFMCDKSERLIEIPDQWGSAIFRKL